MCGFKDTCILHKFHVILMVGFKELFHPYAQSKWFYLIDSQGQTYYGYSLCKQIQYDVDNHCQGFGRAS